MPRLLLIAALLAVLVATTAGVAWAHGGAAVATEAAARDPLLVPPTAPQVEAGQHGIASYRPTAEIAAAIESASPSPHAAGPAPGSASITVTAVVLPTVTLQLAVDGTLESIVTNTPDRDAASVVYAARDAAGERRPLTTSMWKSARAALAEARAGVGTIWSR